MKRLTPIERLEKYRNGEPMTPEQGLTNSEFIALCTDQDLTLSYGATKWAEEKLLYILPGGYQRKGVSHNAEVMQAMNAMFTVLFYPHEIADEINYGEYKENIRKYLEEVSQ